ncbi:phage tail protein [Oceanobacillus caeni]
MIEIPYEFKGTVEYQNYETVVERIEKFDRFYKFGKDQSGTYDMYLIELGNASKPCIFITGSMHGTEWHGTQYSLKFFEDLRDNTFPDTNFRDFVLNNFCIAYIPMINPYGMDRVTDEYVQFNNSARYNVNGVELNYDFYYLTQQESKNVAEQIRKYKPFAYLDMHMFQPDYSVGYGSKFILANGQRETDNVRDLWRDSFENYAGEKMTVWTNTLAPDSGLARAYVARQTNPYTPHTLSYITEFVRPAYIDGEFIEPLTKAEIFKYGTASLYLFFKTSIQYFIQNVSTEEYKSQTMFVRDLNGREYHLQATTTHDFELNGNQSLTFEVLPTKINNRFISDISEMWEVIDDNDVVHKVVYCKKQGIGPYSPGKKRLKVEIKAIPLFFHKLDNSRIYKEYNEHMTAQLAFSRIFDGLPFEFIIVGKFDAVQWEGFGAGESRLETFKRALERYKMEFRIVGNIVYLEHRIGRDTSIQYRHKLNASNIVKEIDGTGFWTYAKGYGDYGNEGDGEGETSDWQNAKLVREYTSPLAKIPSIGILHAPPIKDGRITDRTTMDRSLKTLVDESLKISITADIHDISQQGYALMQAGMGDRVFVIDERIDLDEEVRVTNVSVTKDWRGYILDLNVTIGSEGLAKRHQSNLSTAVKQINELIEGRRELPFSVLDEAVKNATRALQNAQTELIFGGNGIVAKDKKNPNYLTIFNSAGVGVSDDGGNTFRQAITGQGINASTIVTGTMVADFIAGGILSSLNGRTTFNLDTGELDMRDTLFRLGGGASIDFTSTSNRLTYELGGRTAGVGLTTSINENYPVIFMGTTGTARDNFGATDDRWFRGFIANTNARMNEDDSSNSVVGRRFRVTNVPVSWNKGFEFDLSGTVNVFKPIVNTDMTYDIGVPEQPFRNLYAENLRRVSRIETPKEIMFRNQYADSNIGWTMEVTYGGKPTVDFYPINTGTPNYYNIGRADNRINTAYLNVIESNLIGRENRDVNQIWVNTVSYNNLNIRSMRKYKENIEDLELEDALEFVRENDVKTFDYIRSNQDGHRTLYDKKVGIILDDLVSNKDYLVKGSEETLDSGNITFIHQKVLQYLLRKIEEIDREKQSNYRYRSYKQVKSHRRTYRKDVINDEPTGDDQGTITGTTSASK